MGKRRKVRIGSPRALLLAVVVALLALVLALIPPVGPSTAGAEIVAGPTPWPGGTWQPDPATYGMTVESNIQLPMDDGVVLIANVGYPSDLATGQKASGTFPVLLTQSPYVSQQQPDTFFVSRGYINAVVQVRGTGDTYATNGGPVANDLFGERQTKDSVALVDWAARLPGSNGKLGLDGCSFLGIDQIFTAAAVGKDSPIEDILPACASNGYDNYFSGGMPSQIAGLFGSPLATSVSGAKHAEESISSGQAMLNEILAGGPRAYNREYWRERTTYSRMPQIVENGIPALLWSGWTATEFPGVLYEYSILQNAYAGRPPFGAMSPNQKVTGRYQVILGPWGHGAGLDPTIELEWHDTWLKDQDTGIDDTDTPMHLFALGSKKWLNASVFPLTQEYTPLHLGDGTLSKSVPKQSGSATLQWADPTTTGATLTFDAEPVAEEQLLAGPISATIYAKSTTRNLNLIPTLYDVSPTGELVAVATGSLVGSLRAINQKTSWYDANGVIVRPDHPYVADKYTAPNTLQRYDIFVNPAVYSVLPSHHLRLVLSTQPPSTECKSLLSALGIVLPCLPTAPQKETLTGGVFTVEWSKKRPSAINVPLMDADALPEAKGAPTPTSRNQIEPIEWDSPRPRA